MLPFSGYIVTLVAGGLAGALINRYFTISDRKKDAERIRTPNKLILEIVEDSQSYNPVGDGTHFRSEILKRFVLKNQSTSDVHSAVLILNFDDYSIIEDHNFNCTKGDYQCQLKELHKTKLIFGINSFNRTNLINFEVRLVCSYSEAPSSASYVNFFDATLAECTGFEVEIVRRVDSKLPSREVVG